MTQALTKWVFEPTHCKIGFSVTHFGITETEGHFNKFDGTVDTETDDFSDASVTINVDVSSIDTLDKQRDAHLLSADFFHAEKHPQMTFASTGIRVVEPGKYKMAGRLALLGVSKPIELDVNFRGIVPKDPFGNTKAGLNVTGAINRKEWGMTWNNIMDFGGLAVGEMVKISCQIELLKH
ncbi:YceI family protein [Dyadobacter pollutisoli]|uniref:YceI family protein n=1 Tax=Dyadobacter pollutisoli TaxID=2910158 RepID=A0A9E8NAM8_9BACT|nr:YceI family protein [Dyadobacter pollutisoli]WAC12428.1 YceI family protein [Dyadobacter pollutisoli]